MVIFLNGWILPIGRASLGSVCACSLRSRLVFKKSSLTILPLCFSYVSLTGEGKKMSQEGFKREKNYFLLLQKNQCENK